MAYIKIDRGITDHWIYQDAEYFKVWFEMLHRTRFDLDPRTDFIEGELVELNYGEFIFGRIKWSERLKVSEQRLRTLIKKLKAEQMIEVVKEYRKCTVYQIVNYSKFNQQDNQQSDHTQKGISDITNQQSNQPSTSSQPAANQQPTTYKELKKEKNEKKDINKKQPLYKNGRDDPTKINYSDDVWLKPEQYEKLVSDHGESGTKEMIEILNSYKVAKQEIYASDYHTMSGGGWVLKRYREENKLTVINGGARNAKHRTSPERRDNVYDRLSF